MVPEAWCGATDDRHNRRFLADGQPPRLFRDLSTRARFGDPSAPPPISEVLVSPSLPGRRRRPLVILVDDEPLVRRYVERMLRSSGFHVVSIGDGRSALICLAKHEKSVSLVVSDITMPGMGGIELAIEIARRWGSRVPVLLISADPVIPAPQAPFLQKPFRQDQLLSAIEPLLLREQIGGSGVTNGDAAR